MADPPVARAPLSPVVHRGNVTHDMPKGVRPNGSGYQARIKAPGRGWVPIGTFRLLEDAVAARERAIERVKVEGYDWIPLPRPTKPRAAGARIAPAQLLHTCDMSLTSILRTAAGQRCARQQAAPATPSICGGTAIGPKKSKHLRCLVAREARVAVAAEAAASMSDEVAECWLSSIPPPPSPLPRFDPLEATLKGRAHAQLMKAWAESHGQPFQATPKASTIRIPYALPPCRMQRL